MLPPAMPLIHDALWLGAFAGLAFLVWKAAERFDLRLSLPDLRRPVRDVATAPSAWFRTTTVRHASGNTAFDEWRDGELARIETERRALEARLLDFEDFVDKLKQTADRETFEHFMTQFRAMPENAVNQPDYCPSSGRAGGTCQAPLR